MTDSIKPGENEPDVAAGHRRWSPAEDERLRNEWARTSIPQFAVDFRRTQAGIIARANRLGIIDQ
ncbi:hypothetical protein [Sphingomonas sp.]|uniref:hypothetical protein n=1 Tax=Sphingomonas sp. TaxID=28214 RepID=UPI002DD67F00|nr:hypothetical protein [Sphingomonas sp.]